MAELAITHAAVKRERAATAPRWAATARRVRSGGGAKTASSPRARAPSEPSIARRSQRAASSPCWCGARRAPASRCSRAPIHAWSRVAAGPLETLHCAAVPEPLQARELFGCAAGTLPGAARCARGRARARGGRHVAARRDRALAAPVRTALSRALAAESLPARGRRRGAPAARPHRRDGGSQRRRDAARRSAPRNRARCRSRSAARTCCRWRRTSCALFADGGRRRRRSASRPMRAPRCSKSPGPATCASCASACARRCASPAAARSAPRRCCSRRAATRCRRSRTPSAPSRRATSRACCGAAAATSASAARLAKKDRKDFYDVIRRTGVDPVRSSAASRARRDAPADTLRAHARRRRADDLHRRRRRPTSRRRRRGSRRPPTRAPSWSRCPRTSPSCAAKAPRRSPAPRRSTARSSARCARWARATPGLAPRRQLPGGDAGRRRASYNTSVAISPRGEIVGRLPQDPPLRRRSVGAAAASVYRESATRRAGHGGGVVRDAGRRRRALGLLRRALSRSCTAASRARGARFLLRARAPSRARPVATTGRCCCARARSRTSASCWRPRSAAPHPGGRAQPRPLADRRSLGPRARAGGRSPRRRSLAECDLAELRTRPRAACPALAPPASVARSPLASSGSPMPRRCGSRRTGRRGSGSQRWPARATASAPRS